MRKLNLFTNNKGVAAIEMAIVLPILLLIIAAVIEFGLYFLKSQAASRAVSTASIAIQQKPDDGTIQLTMRNNGLGMMDLSALPNFVCAKSYADATQADNGFCIAGEWNTAAPNGLAAGATYYVAVRAFAVHTPLTPLRAMSGAFPPDIDERNVVPINIASNNNGIQLLSSGSGSWQVPAGVKQIKATIIGGGGGSEQNVNDGGGGSGATVIAYIKNLTPLSYINYSIGSGGGITKTAGETTTFNGISAGGGGYSTNCGWASGVAGAGGTASSNQSSLHGAVSSMIVLPGMRGAGCYGGGMPSSTSHYGAGGGPDYPGVGGAVIIEW